MSRGLPNWAIERRSRDGALRWSVALGPSEGCALAVSADGERLVVASDGDLVSLTVDGTDLVRAEVPYVHGLVAVGTRVVSAAFDRCGRLVTHDPRSLAPERAVEIGAPLHDVALLDDGRLACTDHEGRVHFVDGDGARVVFRRPVGMVSIGALAGARLAAAGLQKTIFVVGEAGKLLHWDGLRSIPHRLATSGDEIAAGVGKTLWLARAGSDAPPLELAGHAGIVSALAFDADGTLFTGGEEGWILVWPRAARARGGVPARSIAGRGRIGAIAAAGDAIFVLRRGS